MLLLKVFCKPLDCRHISKINKSGYTPMLKCFKKGRPFYVQLTRFNILFELNNNKDECRS